MHALSSTGLGLSAAAALSACSGTPTALVLDLELHPCIRLLEVDGRDEAGAAVFPRSSVEVAPLVGRGTIALLLPEDGPTRLVLQVRGYGEGRLLAAEWRRRVELRQGEETRVRVLLAAPSACEPERPPSDPPSCGNGRLESSEGCDDGALRPADGCSERCAVEPGWTCRGEPSVCEPDCAAPCAGACPASGCCTLQCGQGADCRLLCPPGCRCRMDCTDSETCEVDCDGDQTVCEIACDGANNCDKARCQGGARCNLTCGTANNCSYERCDGPEAICPGDLRVCNETCP